VYDDCRITVSRGHVDRLELCESPTAGHVGVGDFAVIGTTLQIVGELLNEAADVQATDRVLDVAAGNGNATLAAARRCQRDIYRLRAGAARGRTPAR
jgi:hypothetical protein